MTAEEASAPPPRDDDGRPPLRHVTLDLIRRRSEHNDGLVSTLEEIALHQEELESIGPILGRACGAALRILLLQNNVISRMDPADLRRMRRLEYLNLALNNVRKIEGVAHCEFLRKLDLTLNFVDVDDLEESVDELSELPSLRELYLMGNPCAGDDGADVGDRGEEGGGGGAAAAVAAAEGSGEGRSRTGWAGCRTYVVARLPRLESLDGREVLRSERIVAARRLPALTSELRDLAERRRAERSATANGGRGAHQQPGAADEVGGGRGRGAGDEELTEHSPRVRAEMSREMARQKAEREARERANQPRRRGEREFEEEQRAAVERAREREERGEIRQCNEGKWRFRFDEERRPGYVLLDVPVQRYLSSSLIDVDVHPAYVSIVIKSKVLRLALPAEVRAGESAAQRSATTGHLLLSMPKVDPEENMVHVRAAARAREREAEEEEEAAARASRGRGGGGLASDMLRDAAETLGGGVRIDGLVDESRGGVGERPKQNNPDLKVVSSRRKTRDLSKEDEGAKLAKVEDGGSSIVDDEDSPPPLV